MQYFANKKILLGICGGIAAYKSAFLARELTRLGAEVRVVMTHSAQQFITPMTLQALTNNDVRCELFDPQAERAMGHIELARWADYFVVAPASANCIAKMAHGLADDLLSTIYLVVDVPVILCPAMNRSMWAHEATQTNCELLKQRGVMLVGPEEGSQACGELGFGRLSEVENIITALRLYSVNQLLTGQKVLITAGPTREAIDPVRYISNRSSGKMGYALAQAAAIAGATVTLISGPTALQPPPGITFKRVETAAEMYTAVEEALQPDIVFIGCAAVSDYRIQNPNDKKIKKGKVSQLDISLIENPDILAMVAKSEKAAYVVGFAAETDHLQKNAQEKLEKKKLDMVIANQVGEGIGFESMENQAIVITTNAKKELSLQNKSNLAGQIIAIISTNLHNKRDKNLR